MSIHADEKKRISVYLCSSVVLLAWKDNWGAEHPTHPYFSAISYGAVEAILKLLSNNHIT